MGEKNLVWASDEESSDVFRTRKQDLHCKVERTLDRNMMKIERRAQAVSQQEPVVGGSDQA